MTWKLQEKTIKEFIDSDIGFDIYTAICTKLANHLSIINESRIQDRQKSSRSDATISGAAEKAGTLAARVDMNKRERIPTSGAVTASRVTADELSPEKRELFRSGKYYYCYLWGHISRNCPRKKKEATLKEIEQKAESEGEESLNFQP